MDTKELGNYGEELACGYLVDNGYKILGRNCRIKFGEIDVIAEKKDALGKVLHFVEVKALASGNGFFPEEHVNYKKQRKLRQLAEIYLNQNKFPQDFPYQIDIVAVCEGKVDFFENVVKG